MVAHNISINIQSHKCYINNENVSKWIPVGRWKYSYRTLRHITIACACFYDLRSSLSSRWTKSLACLFLLLLKLLWAINQKGLKILSHGANYLTLATDDPKEPFQFLSRDFMQSAFKELSTNQRLTSSYSRDFLVIKVFILME